MNTISTSAHPQTAAESHHSGQDPSCTAPVRGETEIGDPPKFQFSTTADVFQPSWRLDKDKPPSLSLPSPPVAATSKLSPHAAPFLPSGHKAMNASAPEFQPSASAPEFQPVRPPHTRTAPALPDLNPQAVSWAQRFKNSISSDSTTKGADTGKETPTFTQVGGEKRSEKGQKKGWRDGSRKEKAGQQKTSDSDGMPDKLNGDASLNRSGDGDEDSPQDTPKKTETDNDSSVAHDTAGEGKSRSEDGSDEATVQDDTECDEAPPSSPPKAAEEDPQPQRIVHSPRQSEESLTHTGGEEPRAESPGEETGAEEDEEEGDEEENLVESSDDVEPAAVSPGTDVKADIGSPKGREPSGRSEPSGSSPEMAPPSEAPTAEKEPVPSDEEHVAEGEKVSRRREKDSDRKERGKERRDREKDRERDRGRDHGDRERRKGDKEGREKEKDRDKDKDKVRDRDRDRDRDRERHRDPDREKERDRDREREREKDRSRRTKGKGSKDRAVEMEGDDKDPQEESHGNPSRHPADSPKANGFPGGTSADDDKRRYRYTVEQLRTFRECPECASLPVGSNVPDCLQKKAGATSTHKNRADPSSSTRSRNDFRDSGERRARREKEWDRTPAAEKGEADNRGGESWRHFSRNQGAPSTRSTGTTDAPQTSSAPEGAFKPSGAAWVGRRRDKIGSASREGEIRSILNKLTVEKFDRLFSTLKDAMTTEKDAEGNKRDKECTKDEAEVLVNLLFEKATSQHHFIDMYADVLASIIRDQVIPTEVDIKRLVLTRCQKVFEEYLDPAYSPSGNETEEEYFKYKNRMLGNIKFVARLIIIGIMKQSVISSCVESLLPLASTFDGAAESLCVFITSVATGGKLPKDVEATVLESMRKLSETKTTSSRIRCIFKDALDLAMEGWVQKAQPSGPTTLKAVRRAVAREQGMTSNDFAKCLSRTNTDLRQSQLDFSDSSGWTEVTTKKKMAPGGGLFNRQTSAPLPPTPTNSQFASLAKKPHTRK